MRSTLRSVTLPLLTIAAIAIANREASAQRRITPSLVIGVTSSTLSTPDDGGEVDRRTGLAFGATIDVPLAPNLDFTTGLQLVQKGASVGDPEFGFDAEFELGYLQVPALLRLTLGGQSARPFLEGGGAFAFRISCSVSFSGGGFTVSAPCDEAEDPDTGEPGEDPVESTDASVIVGGGVDFGRVRAGLRYDHGLSTIDRSGEQSIKNRSFVLYLAIRLTR